MKKIHLRGKHGLGKYTLVDDVDFKLLNIYKWRLGKNGYVSGSKNQFIHRVIMNPPQDKEIDHIDGNPLNNQRSNLRIISQDRKSVV